MAVVQREELVPLDQSLSAAVAAVSPSVLHLARSHGGGTALVWKDDLAVTSSFHCPDEPEVMVATPDGDLSSRRATVVGRDPGLDLALLRLDGALVAPAYRDAGTLAVGNLAVALGRPGRSVRASLRMIGVLGQEVRTPAGGVLRAYVETDRMLPRGFAGGPLIDVSGHVIGMSTRTLLRGHDLAIPAGDLERSIAQLLDHGVIPRGYLGLGVTPVALARKLAESVGHERGVLVAALDEGGPAEVGGVRQGDIVLTLDGHPVPGPLELRELVGQRPQAQVELTLVRGGVAQTLSVKLGTRP